MSRFISQRPAQRRSIASPVFGKKSFFEKPNLYIFDRYRISFVIIVRGSKDGYADSFFRQSPGQLCHYLDSASVCFIHAGYHLHYLHGFIPQPIILGGERTTRISTFFISSKKTS